MGGDILWMENLLRSKWINRRSGNPCFVESRSMLFEGDERQYAEG
jgi:hypothetical protein